MTQYEIERHLGALRTELDTVQSMDEETVCIIYNSDCKSEIVELIQEEIASYESLSEQYACSDDGGMDYDALCYSQGISRYA